MKVKSQVRITDVQNVFNPMKNTTFLCRNSQSLKFCSIFSISRKIIQEQHKEREGSPYSSSENGQK